MRLKVKLHSPLKTITTLVLSLTAPCVVADVYELRTYTTNEGKLDNLNARFRDHTVKLFEKHGMENVGYWVPEDAPQSENTLIYVLKHKSRASAQASWKAFLADAEWKKVAKASQVDGKILAQRPESVFMEATDYTPSNSSKKADPSAGTYELRIYRTHPGKLSKLDSRFREHTMRIFEQHGMTNVAYWHPTDEPDSTDTLIYILRHDNREAATASWKAFGSDPAWRKVAKESQKDGKFLRERPESIYMQATDYSPLK